ncbi:MAG: hypothetical protein PHW41_02160 [Eubacteriales bacterium]|nr:hypothetical protein [Eubacteriales bacterium]
MEQSTPQRGHGHHGHHDYGDLPRHGAARVIFYFIMLIILNVMLAVYSIYMLGLALAFDWSSLASGTLQAILESALNLLLYFSPIILTLFLNRLLYRAFRGRGRFARGTWLFAMLAIVIVQFVTLAFIFNYGYVEGVDGLRIDQIAVSPIN